jgi:hypothetical protein
MLEIRSSDLELCYIFHNGHHIHKPPSNLLLPSMRMQNMGSIFALNYFQTVQDFSNHVQEMKEELSHLKIYQRFLNDTQVNDLFAVVRAHFKVVHRDNLT